MMNETLLTLSNIINWILSIIFLFIACKYTRYISYKYSPIKKLLNNIKDKCNIIFYAETTELKSIYDNNRIDNIRSLYYHEKELIKEILNNIKILKFLQLNKKEEKLKKLINDFVANGKNWYKKYRKYRKGCKNHTNEANKNLLNKFSYDKIVYIIDELNRKIIDNNILYILKVLSDEYEGTNNIETKLMIINNNLWCVFQKYIETIEKIINDLDDFNLKDTLEEIKCYIFNYKNYMLSLEKIRNNDRELKYKIQNNNFYNNKTIWAYITSIIF